MLCPKCQRPIEDEGDGVYICCAHANLRWRCNRCDKVSEGFAFPYGRCPHCSGVLELLDTSARTDDVAALDGLRMAFEIELGGRAFYQRAAAESTDPTLKSLFGRFALMEGEHMETLSRRYHIDVPEPSPQFRVDVAAIFAGVENRPAEPANLFQLAIALEKRASEFFTLHSELATEQPGEQQLYRELAAEEREHAAILATEYERWQAGKPGLFSGEPLAGAARPAAQAAAQINAAALLLGEHDPQRTALVCGAATISYGALRDRVARAAGVWRARGIGTGDRVAVKLPDGPDWVTAFLGAIWSGAVAVAVNPRIPAAEWQYILDEAGFSVILAEAGDDTPAPWRDRVLPVADWAAEVARAAPLPAQPMDPDAPAFWCHSSGTSGKPKAVVHGHRYALRIEQVSREALGLLPTDRLYGSSKLFFSYPQTNCLFAGLKLGATVILDPQWPTAASVAACVAAQRPTVLFSVPSLYRNLLHDGLAPAIAQAGVRLCVSAGEALPASLRDEWQRQTGLTIVNGYGASETLALMMIDRGDGHGFQPSPGVEVRPLEAVAAGAPARICIRAPTLALGYLDRPQAQADAFRDGAFCPADLFAHDDTGGWRFAGREDSLVKIHGRWVNLVELEERLRGPDIAESAAVCVPDADGVDAVAYFYVAGNPAAARAALQATASALPPHQRPRWLHAVATLPRTPTGKILRRKLQDLHRTLA